MNTFNIGEVFSKGWNTYKSNFWLLLGAQVVIGLIYCAIFVLFTISLFMSGLGSEEFINILDSASDEINPAEALILMKTFLPALILAGIALFLASVYLTLGLLRMYLKLIRGHQVDLGDIFSGKLREFGSYVLGSILLGIIMFVVLGLTMLLAIGLGVITPALSIIGMILGAIIFLFVVIRFAFFTHLIVDKGDTGYQSLAESKRITKAHFWSIFGTFILVGLISGVTSLVLSLLPFIPLHFLFVVPLITLFIAAMYVQLVDGKVVESQEVTEPAVAEEEVIEVEEK